MNIRDRKDDYFIWVIAPYLETDDPELRYYYDYTQSIAEYRKVFDEIGCEWKWLNVTFLAIEESIKSIKDHPSKKIKLVINLCDGDELNEIPGVSVIEALEKHDLMYTGSDLHFYTITTSKIPMKVAFDTHGVSTPRWKVASVSEQRSDSPFDELGKVLIVKPAISAGSMGISVKNVVSTEDQYWSVVEEMQRGYRGWRLDGGGIFVEEFIKGREFTTLVVGSSSHPDSIKVYPPVERIFHSSLPDHEKFLSYDRLWETYNKESPLPGKGTLYTYYEPENELIGGLEAISREAFRSVGGTGYGRLDIRMDDATGKLYVLEVNAQCGLSEDENYTSIGAILRFAKKSFTSLLIEIMEDAIVRYGAKHKAMNK